MATIRGRDTCALIAGRCTSSGGGDRGARHRVVTLGWGGVGGARLAIASVFWVALLGPVLANWTIPTSGVSLMVAVSTESLAALAATLAGHEGAAWLVYAALAPFLLGLGLYVFVI
jgi:hypothetical protein